MDPSRAPAEAGFSADRRTSLYAREYVRYRALAPHHTPRFAPDLPAPGARARALALPGYRQARNYSCGYACSLMVIRYYRPAVGGRDLFDRLGTGMDGTRQTAIVRELRASGLSANVRYDVDFARLQREVDQNKLVISYLHDIDHWVVLYGYGLEPSRVYVADPRPQEICQQPWEPFSTRLRGFGIVCADPDARVSAPPIEESEPATHQPAPIQLAFDF